GHLGAYLCDFPSETNRHHPKVVALPHLGASTGEAEDNSAMMVADEVRDYLEDGNVRNSVNFPETVMERVEGAYRVAVVNSNVPNILGQVSTDFADAGLNIIDMINKSRGDLAYTLVDVDQPVPDSALEAIRETPGVLSVRIL
ncbi:MAG: phosphoglycerate dehydrogenase, partial [Thiohalospira sp.]